MASTIAMLCRAIQTSRFCRRIRRLGAGRRDRRFGERRHCSSPEKALDRRNRMTVTAKATANSATARALAYPRAL